MAFFDRLRDALGQPIVTLGEKLPVNDAAATPSPPDWIAASPAWIERALGRAASRPTGGWYALGASRDLGAGKPRRYRAAGRDYVVWRDGVRVLAGPDACPHMGASLSEGRCQGGRVVCPWHGLALADAAHGRWKALRAHDDGVLLWLRAEGDDAALTALPILSPRPARALAGVIRVEARCEPEDVIANRLDPWHGVHFHAHSFARLRVLRQGEDEIAVRVAYRVAGPLCVEVDAVFSSPQPRCIVMRIEAGEGAGSVVETHALPLDPGRTAIIEATLATSRRRGFGVALGAGLLIRPFIERAARRLWRDDAAYAERRYALRTGAA